MPIARGFPMKIMGRLKMRIGRNPYVFLMALAAAPILAVGLAERTVGQTSSSGAKSESSPKTSTTGTALKTSWGEPDLQGIWSNGGVVISFQRDKKYGERQYLTEAEHQKALDDLAKRNARVGRDNREGRGTEKDVARAYNDFW